MIRATIVTLVLAAPVMAQEDRTPDWRTAKTPVPHGWTARQQSDFEETAHGDPVFVGRQQAGMHYGGSTRSWFHPQYRAYRYYTPRYYLYR